MLTALLITCAISTQTPSDPPGSIATAPKLPPWPAGLSEAREESGETILPPDRSEAVLRRLVACESLPSRCQARLDALWAACGARVAGAVHVERADCLGARVESRVEAEARRTWEVLLWLGGGVVVGMGAGLVVGLLAGGR